MAAKVWANLEVLTAAQQNVVAAQADDALKPAGNLAGLASKAAARANLDLVAVAASGDYGDLINRLVDTTDGAAGGLDLIDDGMEVGTVIVASAAGIAVGDLIIGIDGTISAPVYSAPSAILAGARISASDAAAGVDTIDDGMEIGASVERGGSQRIGDLEIIPEPGPPGIALSDPGMESPLDIGATGMGFAGIIISTSDAGPGLDIIDDGMEVAAFIAATGASDGFGGTSVTTHSDAEIERRNAECLASAAGMATNVVTNIARPVYELNHFLSYGQSLSIGSEGTPILSGTAKYDNLMYGDQIRPTTNNSATATWDRVGASAFNPMVTTGGTEVPIAGALNTFRRLYLASRGIVADVNTRFVASSAGIGGQDIASLSLGASPDIYQRVISCMAQASAQAATDAKTYGVIAMLWIQGESDQTRTSAYYLPLMRAIYSDFVAAVDAETGQPDPPAMFTYQTAAPNTNFDTAEMGVQMAQLTMALDDDGVFMVGPNYPYPDSNNLHLPANSYRWMGSQFGKVMHRVLSLGHRWKPLHMRRATLRGREVLIDFHVPYPPLVFEDPWMQSGWFIGETVTGGTNTQYAVPDKGFSVRTTAGVNQTISSVALASETQVLITLATAPSGTLIVRYANGRESHFGHGSVRDSDPALADDVWTDGVVGQTYADTNATLSGARYPLHNWAVAQQIDIEVMA